MKNYDEYKDNIKKKAHKIKSRRRIAWSCAAVFVVVLAFTLFVPYNNQMPNVDRYQDSPYFKLIPGINKMTYQPPAHKNNYEWLKSLLSERTLYAPTSPDFIAGGIVMEDAAIGSPSYGVTITPEASPNGTGQKYEEVTDNQVQGVIESDIFKRSDQYIYYLRNNVLSVYSIEKEDSRRIATVTLPMEQEVYSYNFEMFLSQDCTTLTVVSQQGIQKLGACTVVYSLDVTDPYNIVVQQPQYFRGSYISSRMVNGALLLIYNYRVTGEIDFDKPETFVPTYGTIKDMTPIAADDIYCPAEEPNSARYTVIAKLDGKTLQVQDTAALLSYSNQIYVSQTAVYATYGCTRTTTEGELTVQSTVTEITGISYTGENLDVLGTITVDGSVKDQYSLDEYDGFLRIATSTSVMTGRMMSTEYYAWMDVEHREENCNLYCVDLRNWEVAASVIAFAPEGEEVTSARFDGPVGYICTAEMIILSDPVYFFDLSDLSNITYKHTPVIDGYSSSLINFGEYLLGVGYNEKRQLKIEVYEETAHGVEPIAAYEREAWFSEDYKSYYIDRERNMIGLSIGDYNKQTCYLLLYFDGYEFQIVDEIPISGAYVGTARADIIDGYLYLLEKTLHVVKLF